MNILTNDLWNVRKTILCISQNSALHERTCTALTAFVTVHWHGAGMGSVGGGDAGMLLDVIFSGSKNKSPHQGQQQSILRKRIHYNNRNAKNIKTQLIMPRPTYDIAKKPLAQLFNY